MARGNGDGRGCRAGSSRHHDVLDGTLRPPPKPAPPLCDQPLTSGDPETPGGGRAMKREVIRVEPLSTFLERRKTPTSVVIRHGDTIYVSGLPPFDLETGEIVDAPLERQTEVVLEQLKRCVEAAGSSLEKVVRCTVYCTSSDSFPALNA